MTKVAAVQMASGAQVDANLMEAEKLIQLAVRQEASLVVLPENFVIMGMQERDKVKVREAYGQGPIQDFLREQARRNGIWLVGGTIPLECDEPDKVIASSLLMNPDGEVAARYDKIHLFDVNLIDNNESYNESETIKSGSEVVVVETPIGKIGMAICYDLRFPEMFRLMVEQGVEIFVLPSAFTAVTGAAHWECLVRARAIENLAYVVAANQGGYHINGRATYGDSMIVDPWGRILNRLGQGAGVVVAEIDLEKLTNTRRNFPCLAHRAL